MSASGPRRGIERKILNTILQVAILPLVITVIVGYVTAREGQSNAVEEALLNAAGKTANGLRIASAPYLDNVQGLVRDPKIVEALSPGPTGEPAALTDAEVRQNLAQHIEDRVIKVPRPSRVPTILSIFGPGGRFIVGTNPDIHTITSEDNGPSKWAEMLTRPVFLDVDVVYDSYAAEIVGPVYAVPDKQQGLLGFISQIVDIKPMLLFAMGIEPFGAERKTGPDSYQIIYTSEGYHWTSYVAEAGSRGVPQLEIDPTDSTLSKVLQEKPLPRYGALRINDYLATNNTREDAFLAYAQMFENMNLYIVVYRSAAQALRNIHLGGIIAIVFCIGVIVILCLNAYLNIHNNIVRPLSLLNEGAQIIGQGDLDLKLKIGTGDEVEELAQSFNKMALALKRNIRQLEDSEEKYRGLVTWMRDGIFHTDPAWILDFMNPAGIEIFRFKNLEEILGNNISSTFYNPEDFAQFAAELEQKGFIERRRVWMKRRDERAIIVELSANTIYGDENTVIGYEGIFRDLSKSVRLEREARDRAERLSAISQIANVINSSLEAGRLYENLVVENKRLIDF
ncbi:MAG: HAMP domain-containing protein, partial [Candidatus Hydrogenedentes bacterium]|nr:HAMP domain-containing protein [Candidatus Hydrogenedentota bacterium]